MYLIITNKNRYIEMSVYRITTYKKRYMQISMYLGTTIHSWKFPCNLWRRLRKVHRNVHVPCTSKVHRNFYVLMIAIHSWKFQCTCDYCTCIHGKFHVTCEYVQEKAHKNIHVPCDYIQGKVRGNLFRPGVTSKITAELERRRFRSARSISA